MNARAEKLAEFCRWYNQRHGGDGRVSEYYGMTRRFMERLVKEEKDVKLKTMYVPRWKRKIILAAWIGGELVYDRREDG